MSAMDSPEHCKSALASTSNAIRTERNRTAKSKAGHKYHFNSIWSIWYCIVTAIFTIYLAYTGVQRFLMYTSLPWPDGEQPFVQLNAYVGLVGAAVVVMPFFVVVSLLKVGNLANDGCKLGSSLSACSRSPPSILKPTTGIVRNLWLHGVPTGPFLHLVAAFCFFLPKVLMDASLVKGGFLPRDNVWRTDIDPLVLFNERLHLRNETLAPIADSLVHIRTTSRLERAAQVQWSNQPFPHPYESKPNIDYGIPDYFIKASTLPPPSTGPDPILIDSHDWRPFSAELVYYVFALLVFAVRYPSVYWNTSKTFSFIFSIQLILNGMQTVLTLCSFSIFYKIQMNDPKKELLGTETFLLGPHLSLLLMVAALITVTANSTCLYVYGYQQFTKFMFRSKQRFHIAFDQTPLIVQPYTGQICALITLISLGLCYGPLLWDLTIVYKGSLDAVVLTAIIATVIYILLWILLWLFLTLKSKWIFKLRVTVARAFVSSARSIKLVNDVEMMSPEECQEKTLLVVGSGKAYAIQDASPQEAIMDVVHTVKQEQRNKGEEVYWLRPKSSKHANKSLKTGSSKVTFSKSVDQDSLARKMRHQRDLHFNLTESEDEGGDYAFLKASSPQESDGTISPQLEENPRYVDRRQILAYREASLHDMSPRGARWAAPDYEDTDYDHSPPGLPSQHQMFLDSQGPLTPRSTRSTDSGMPPESQSQRSDSISSSVSTNTPQENSEESGVHSANSYRMRSNSVDDLTHIPAEPVHPNFPHVQRPPNMSISGIYGYCKANPPVGHYKVMYPSNETTMAIKRQRNLTQEIKPPQDPIYGTRKLTSFTDSIRQHNEKKMAVGRPQSNCSGYQSDSPIPSLPLAPISEQSYPMLSSNYAQQALPQVHTPNQYMHGSFQVSAQHPLPAIPHSIAGLDNLRNEIYGRSSGPPQPLFSQLNRSASLRLPTGTMGHKQYTNTLPHVLPKDSFYNTNV